MAYPLSASQVAVVNTLLGTCKQYNAPPAVCVAIICAGVLESNLSTSSDNGTYWGALSGSHTNFPNRDDAVGMATSFLNGGRGFRSALELARGGVSNPLAIASQSEGATPFDSAGISGQYKAETIFPSVLGIAEAIAAQYGGGASIPKGGTAGLGGTGTPASQPSTTQLTIGQTGNPNEDYWTGINRLASDVSWYCYADAERLYYMDGADLIVQTPAAYVDWIDDAAQVQHLSFLWDNTAFQYSSTHKHKQRVQHKTRLAHVSSPTEARLDIICEPDFFRGGDVVVLSSCGPGDGRWLVSDCTRSVFAIFSSLTLVPPIMPLSEAQAVGTTGASTGGAKPGTSVVNPKTGKTVGGKGGYQNPFPGGWIPNRLDMGYDGTFTGQIVAPFDGTITYAATSFSNWGGYVQLKASSPVPGLPSDTLYFAEGVSPACPAGTKVTAGTPICNAAPSPYGNAYGTSSSGTGEIEWGPAASAGAVGTPTNPLAESGVSNPAGMVLGFVKWVEQNLGVAPPSETGHAGSA